jgi:hypothetical protein
MVTSIKNYSYPFYINEAVARGPYMQQQIQRYGPTFSEENPLMIYLVSHLSSSKNSTRHFGPKYESGDFFLVVFPFIWLKKKKKNARVVAFPLFGRQIMAVEEYLTPEFNRMHHGDLHIGLLGLYCHFHETQKKAKVSLRFSPLWKSVYLYANWCVLEVKCTLGWHTGVVCFGSEVHTRMAHRGRVFWRWIAH